MESEGWYNMIQAVTEGDITKEDQVLKYPLMKILQNFRYKSKVNYNAHMNRQKKI